MTCFLGMHKFVPKVAEGGDMAWGGSQLWKRSINKETQQTHFRYFFLLIVIARQSSLKKRVLLIKFNNPIWSEEVLCQPKLRMFIQRHMSPLTWPVQRSLYVCLVEMWYLASGSRNRTERVTCVIQWRLKKKGTFCSTDNYIAILDKGFSLNCLINVLICFLSGINLDFNTCFQVIVLFSSVCVQYFQQCLMFGGIQAQSVLQICLS